MNPTNTYPLSEWYRSSVSVPGDAVPLKILVPKFNHAVSSEREGCSVHVDVDVAHNGGDEWTATVRRYRNGAHRSPQMRVAIARALRMVRYRLRCHVTATVHIAMTHPLDVREVDRMVLRFAGAL